MFEILQCLSNCVAVQRVVPVAERPEVVRSLLPRLVWAFCLKAERPPKVIEGLFEAVRLRAEGDRRDHRVRQRHNQNPKPFIWTASANDILAKVKRARKAMNKL